VVAVRRAAPRGARRLFGIRLSNGWPPVRIVLGGRRGRLRFVSSRVAGAGSLRSRSSRSPGGFGAAHGFRRLHLCSRAADVRWDGAGGRGLAR